MKSLCPIVKNNHFPIDFHDLFYYTMGSAWSHFGVTSGLRWTAFGSVLERLCPLGALFATFFALLSTFEALEAIMGAPGPSVGPYWAPGPRCSVCGIDFFL